MNRSIRIVALTEAGKRLAERLQSQLENSEVNYKPKPFADKIQQAFNQGDALILICATGIAVRTLAPVIKSKLVDPPVLVLDEAGKFVIPLLSGHEGQANDWGSEISHLLQAQLVLTTAQDYLQPIYTIGMGCERHCPESELYELLTSCLQQAGLRLEQIRSINSIDIKSDEQGLIGLARSLNKDYQTFDTSRLSTVEEQLSTKSDYIFKTVGVYGVAESAALYAAREATQSVAELVLKKQKTKKATCAIARSYPEEKEH